MFSSPVQKMLPALLFTTALVLQSHAAEAREQIRVVGSSTVFPFTAATAEQFGQGGKFKTPIVESTGTGGGFKLFCEGTGADTPDINNASRPMTDSEKELCKKNGVTGVTELPIGYDGIAVAAGKNSPTLNLTRKDIFMALAKEVPNDGKLVANPNKTWKDVNPALANEPIEVYGPPPTSGTRDAFVELAMEVVCKEMAEFKTAYADEKERGKACKTMREDGKYIDAGEDDNVIVQKLKSNPNALGIFGYSYLVENQGSLQGMKIDGVSPVLNAISDGSYKLSRTLFIYVKNDHLGKIPGLAEFAREVTSAGAMGKSGYMVTKGLIPLHDKEAAKSHSAATALVSSSLPAAGR